MKTETQVNSDRTLLAAIAELQEMYREHGYISVKMETGKTRTSQQNRALHKWLSMLSELLNSAGLDMRRVIKQDVDIPWNTESAKEYLWRPVQKVIIDKESTADAERTDYNKVYEVLSRHLSMKFGVNPPSWPQGERDE